MAIICTVCSEEIDRLEAYATCSVADCSLHFKCAGITEKSWLSMSKPTKSKWRCIKCRENKSSVEYSQTVSADELRRFMSAVTHKLNELSDLVPTVKQLEKSVQHMSDKHDELLGKMKIVSSKIITVEKNIEANNEDIKVIKEKILFLEQVSRNKNIEIIGVPKIDDENLEDIINNLARKLDINSTNADVDVMHRLPASNGKIPKIVVQFKTRQVRDMWVSAKKSRLSSSEIVQSGGPSSPVRIFEQLTPDMKDLLWKTKQAARARGYQLVWFKNNKILVKKDITDRVVIRISSEDDIVKLQH